MITRNRAAAALSITLSLASLCSCHADAPALPPPLPPPPMLPPPPAPHAPVTIADRVYFDEAAALLRDEDLPTLDRVAQVIKDNPQVRLVELQAHTDNSGAEDKNLMLSDARGEVVKGYLVSKGVDASRLRVHAFGKTIPIETNGTEPGRLHNRRVEFRVIQQ